MRAQALEGKRKRRKKSERVGRRLRDLAGKTRRKNELVRSALTGLKALGTGKSEKRKAQSLICDSELGEEVPFVS